MVDSENNERSSAKIAKENEALLLIRAFSLIHNVTKTLGAISARERKQPAITREWPPKRRDELFLALAPSVSGPDC